MAEKISAVVYISAGETFAAAGTNLRINGTNKGTETVVIIPDLGTKYGETHHVVVTKTVEVIDLSLLEDATYQSAGNSLKVFDAAGETLITQIFMQPDGTETILPGQTTLSLATLTSGTISIDGKALSTDAPGPLEPPQNTGEITKAGESDASGGEKTFHVIPSADGYTHIIKGFSGDDKLELPANTKENAISFENATFGDGLIDVTYESQITGTSVRITLTGLTTAQDNVFEFGDLSEFTAAFGEGTLVLY